MDVLIFFSITLIGACLGSFSTAVSYRIIQGQSWILNTDKTFSRSFCPQCRHQLSILELVPILSWLFLKGRCRNCEGIIAVRYLYIELSAVFFSLLAYVLLDLTLSFLFFLIAIPFLLAQIIVIYQKRVISLQLCFIMTLLLFAFFLLVYWT